MGVQVTASSAYKMMQNKTLLRFTARGIRPRNTRSRLKQMLLSVISSLRYCVHGSRAQDCVMGTDRWPTKLFDSAATHSGGLVSLFTLGHSRRGLRKDLVRIVLVKAVEDLHLKLDGFHTQPSGLNQHPCQLQQREVIGFSAATLALSLQQTVHAPPNQGSCQAKLRRDTQRSSALEGTYYAGMRAQVSVIGSPASTQL